MLDNEIPYVPKTIQPENLGYLVTADHPIPGDLTLDSDASLVFADPPGFTHKHIGRQALRAIEQ